MGAAMQKFSGFLDKTGGDPLAKLTGRKSGDILNLFPDPPKPIEMPALPTKAELALQGMTAQADAERKRRAAGTASAVLTRTEDTGLGSNKQYLGK